MREGSQSIFDQRRLAASENLGPTCVRDGCALMPGHNDTVRYQSQAVPIASSDGAGHRYQVATFESWDRLRLAREALGIEQRELARRAAARRGVPTLPSVSRYEKDRRPDVVWFDAFAAELGVLTDWLLYGRDPWKPDGSPGPKPKPGDDLDATLRLYPRRWTDDVVKLARGAKFHRSGPKEGWKAALDNFAKITDSQPKGGRRKKRKA